MKRGPVLDAGIDSRYGHKHRDSSNIGRYFGEKYFCSHGETFVAVVVAVLDVVDFA